MNTQMTYTQEFDKFDPNGDIQGNAEDAIAAQLFYEYREETPRWHAALIVESVYYHVCLDSHNHPFLDLYTLVEEVVLPYIEHWISQLDSQGYPDEEEANQAGKELLRLCLATLHPEYIEEKQCNEKERREG